MTNGGGHPPEEVTKPKDTSKEGTTIEDSDAEQ